MQCKSIIRLILLTSIISLSACNQNNTSSASKPQSQTQTENNSSTTPQSENTPQIWPEQDETKKGTPVLGFKLGDSNYQSVTHQLSGWDDLGINNYSQGKMIATNGNGYGIDNLKQVTYIFDQNDALQAVLMQIDNRNNKMNNEGFKKIKGYISKRGYKLVSNQEPFVGDQYAEYKTPVGDVIEISAPHLSFDLNVDYQTAAFIKAYQTKRQQEKTEKTNTESAQF